MSWWEWLIVVLVVLAVVGALVTFVQTKRRSSGVIIGSDKRGKTP